MRTSRARLQLLKCVKEAFELAGGYSRSSVSHLDLQEFPKGLRRSCDAHRNCAIVGELYCIRKQIVENLSKSEGVTPSPAKAGPSLQLE